MKYGNGGQLAAVRVSESGLFPGWRCWQDTGFPGAEHPSLGKPVPCAIPVLGLSLPLSCLP